MQSVAMTGRTAVLGSRPSRAVAFARPALVRAPTVRVAAYKITIENPKDKSCKSFECDGAESILEAAVRSKVDIPSLCHTGSCGVCAARVVEGELERSDSTLLEPAMETMGFTLLCCTYPKSDMKLLSHQEGDMHTVPFNL